MTRSFFVLASAAAVLAVGWVSSAEARDWRLRSLYDNYVLEEPEAYYFDDEFDDDEVDDIIVPPRRKRVSIYQFEDDYYDPRFEPKTQPRKKTASQKPPTAVPTTPSAKSAALVPAKPAAVSKPAAKPAAVSGVTCEKATSVVGTYGFTDVKPVACSGKVYTFNALRGAKKYEIKVSAVNGSLTEVKKLQ
jgi:hypothetical protein